MQKIFSRTAWTCALCWLLVLGACTGSSPEVGTGPSSTTSATTSETGSTAQAEPVRVGAEVWADDGFAALDGLRVGLVTNSAIRLDDRLLLDVMLAAGVDVVTVFTPEHGFDGKGAAGALVAGGVDEERGLAVVSLYGEDRAPTPATLTGVDVLVFDLQDIGVRAYTYLATMGLAMAAAADADIPFFVLDRPNPLGDQARQGWVREDGLESFVSQYPIPAVHGMTAGEMARAIKGEGWLPGAANTELTVVGMTGWQRHRGWAVTGLPWHPPSPSLPTTDSVLLYPGTVLLEATVVALGRGTPEPFTVVGAPWVDGGGLAEAMNRRALPGVKFEPTTFTATASEAVPSPPYVGQELPAVRIVIVDPVAVRPVALGVHLLAELSAQAAGAGVDPVIDRPEMLDLLAGSDELRLGLAQGRSADDLVAGWTDELAAFDQLRAPYLLYD